MSKFFIKRPELIEAISFCDLIKHGINQCRNEGRESSIINGMPWSFSYKECAVTHENDKCYLISTPDGGTIKMTPEDVLIINQPMHVRKANEFDATHTEFIID